MKYLVESKHEDFYILYNISRRAKMKYFLIVLVIFSVGISGCVLNNSDSSDENVLNMAIFWLDNDVDPINGWNGWTLTRCGIGENLVQMDENMILRPSIADSYEIVDEYTTVFHIRDGVTFHNGNSVDATACKASIERALEKTDRFDVKFPVESITADGQNLIIKTSEPSGTMLNKLADTVFIIVDASAADEEDFKYKPICTGTFKIEEFNADKGMVLSKHKGHWLGNTNVDVVNVKYIQDASARAMALQAKEIDLATQLSNHELELFEDNEDFIVQKGPNLRVFLLRLNFEKPYMKELAFRQALSYGMDKETYAFKLVDGTPAKGPINELLSFGYKGEDYYQYNPGKANELLDELGYLDTDGDGVRECNGKNIVLQYISRTNHGADANNIGIAMQQQYKEIGIGMKISQMENYADLANSGNFDMLWERWTSAPTGDCQYFIESGYITNAAGNYGKYSNVTLDAINSELNSTLNKNDRDALGLKATELMMEDVASLFIYYQEGNIVTSKKVEGVKRFISEIYYVDDRVRLVDA
ncbi:ABC transporter substrate-binding protein [Methanomethylovorans sp.]|uniref:ABC transporter substrate-binding protein n=1 Tax=Methanomethylovorans sp. TaxID=2758717 RepID=UPI001BD60037